MQMDATNGPRLCRRSLVGRAALIAVALSGALVLAACGSSGSKASPATQPTAAKPGVASPSIVKTTSNSSFGTLLVDAKGRTLYTLTKGGRPVACTGQCATFWPPLLLTSGATQATDVAGVTGLGTVSANGGMQVTKNGAPLHRFSGDAARGDAKGDGIASFGGVWHVVKSAGTSKAGSSATTTTASVTTTTASGGGGYHY